MSCVETLFQSFGACLLTDQGILRELIAGVCPFHVFMYMFLHWLCTKSWCSKPAQDTKNQRLPFEALLEDISSPQKYVVKDVTLVCMIVSPQRLEHSIIWDVSYKICILRLRVLWWLRCSVSLSDTVLIWKSVSQLLDAASHPMEIILCS